MFGWLRPWYSVTLYDCESAWAYKKNWREVVAWCGQTFDKNNYSCEISLNRSQVSKVIVKIKNKDDYVLLALTWLEDWA